MDIEVRFGFLPVTYVHKTRGNELKGRNLKEAGHVTNLVERSSQICAKVVRQTSVNLPPYQVVITIDSRRAVVDATCNCIAGISSHCKHISAVIIAVNEEDSRTKTSGACEWLQPLKEVRSKYSKGKLLTEIFKAPKRVHFYEPYSVKKCMVEFKNPCMLQYMLNDYQQQTSTPDACTDVEQHGVVRTLSGTEHLTTAIIKMVIEGQLNSDLLKQLYYEDLPFFEPCCINLYNSKLPCTNIIKIAIDTAVDKSLWALERKYRITASRAYDLYTYKGNDWTEKSRKYFYPKQFTNCYTEHGLKYEPVAREVYAAYADKRNCLVIQMGLIICKGNPWLAVSPDGVVVENGQPTKLLEIKCPYKGKMESADTIEEACNFLKRDKGQLILKTKHKYYAQVQISMAVLNLKSCDFVVFSSHDKSAIVVPVPFNEEFARNLLFKLKNIYFSKMLHTLCDKQ